MKKLKNPGTVLLSFDIEEFDTPLEYGKKLSWQEQINISREGTQKILDLLLRYNTKATFYSTVSFAGEVPDLIQRIMNEGHELASHGLEHSAFRVEHLAESKQQLEALSGRLIRGYRMARMLPVDEKEVMKAGYLYNSSLNPTFLPGRYNNFRKPRTVFYQDGIWQFPASVSTFLRIPLFWLSFHNLPFSLYQLLCKKALRKDRYLHIYFHPWEFCDISDRHRFGLPLYISKNSGDEGIRRLGKLISWLKIEQKADFLTTSEFLLDKINAEE
ncbi:MAG: polysaccharide deacetylase family protein [Bacteroidota bacterium]|nr:polysaccharide deacetylase family protein [Bacteroidota bacterium]